MCAPLLSPLNPQIHNKFVEENNKKALELLLKIQQQVENSRVIATSIAVERIYE